jgi:putative ubiquitin-RnfH superfamily antitoxin RatB of RatAB toxin-antitoxin module
MMLVLGFSLGALVWLGLTVVLVRRAGVLAEHRLRAGISVRTAEVQSERDELRARHAVEMHRLERELSRVFAVATAHRFQADVKDRDLRSLKAELSKRIVELAGAEQRLVEQGNYVQDLERGAAEAGAELQAAQQALKLESRRFAIADKALDEAAILAEKGRIEIMRPAA